jgi:glycosyltransferase involved in cell wall biosynthesis
MPAIHQLVAVFSRGDAISNESVVMRSLFRQWGYESEIFCEQKRILPELRGEARDLSEVAERVKDDDVVLLHLSIGSPANEVFPSLKGKKAILYHNITPPEYFRLIQPATAQHLAKGREQARALAGVATINLADSQFNAEELKQWGYANPRVLPLMLDFHRLTGGVDRAAVKRLSDGKKNVLFVGRCAPNKKIEDVITLFAYFQKAVQPESRLILAGSYAGTERYQRLLLTMVRDMKLENVEFMGSIPQAELNACYRAADVFVCMSEHEGFCIPLIEALVQGVPVLAYAAAAVPETLGGAGILFGEKRFEEMAEMMGCVVRDKGLRQAVLARQAERIGEYKGLDLAGDLRRYLGPLLGR